jgi:hypothetical protein
VKKLQAAYACEIPNIPDKQQQPIVDKGFKVYPPVAKTKKGPGRQKKNRILNCLERTGKATRQVTCKTCGELGHRAASWRCPVIGTKKVKFIMQFFLLMLHLCIYVTNQLMYRKRTKKVGKKKQARTEEEPAAATTEKVGRKK